MKRLRRWLALGELRGIERAAAWHDGQAEFAEENDCLAAAAWHRMAAFQIRRDLL